MHELRNSIQLQVSIEKNKKNKIFEKYDHKTNIVKMYSKYLDLSFDYTEPPKPEQIVQKVTDIYFNKRLLENVNKVKMGTYNKLIS